MSVALTGGGTGGHLTIVDAVVEHLEQKPIYIGSTKGQDRVWFENDDRFSKTFFMQTQTVVDKGFLGKVKTLWQIAKETLKAKEILKQEGVKVVFSVGGFSAAPASFAAIMLRIPLIIHEQNAFTGNLNRVLKPFATSFVSTFEDGNLAKTYPVKSIFFETARVRDKIKTVLISGGSQGSVSLNNFAIKLAPIFKERGIKIYHQAGVKNVEKVIEDYKKIGVEAEIFGFTKDMPSIISKADFAIARAGASTLWEMTANGLPALFVPYPYAANDHQYYNAKYLVDKGLAWVCRDKDLNEDIVLDILDKDLSDISKKLIGLIEPNGAKVLAEHIESFL